MIPTIDLGAFAGGSIAERKVIAESVDNTCRTIGFLVIENHGVPDAICDSAWRSARQFFDLPLDVKLASKSPDSRCPRGYFPVAEETLAKTRGQPSPPDPKEAFSCGPPAPPTGHKATKEFDFFYGTNLWPAELPGFEQTWLAYYSSMEKLGASIMQMLAEALDVDTNFFEPFHSHHLSALRGINYPDMASKNKAPRAGAHSDYGSVTILKADPEVGGLEVQSRDGAWISAPATKSGFIVNIGDLMARWTGNRWVSTLHRVVAPGGDAVPRRQSIAYFMNPNYDAEISVIPSCKSKEIVAGSIIAGKYLINQFRSAF